MSRNPSGDMSESVLMLGMDIRNDNSSRDKHHK